MALINRVSRLFRADMHALLDRVEEPEVLLRQSIREMQEDIFEREKRIKLIDHELSVLSTRLSDLTASLTDVEDELDVCFDSDNEDLARVLIKRKLEAERIQKILVRKQDGLTQERQSLSQRIQQDRARLGAMQQKADLLCRQETRSQHEDKLFTEQVHVRDEDIEVALLREKQKRKLS